MEPEFYMGMPVRQNTSQKEEKKESKGEVRYAGETISDEERYAPIRNFELVMEICVEVTRKKWKMNPEVANPSIETFRKGLGEFHLKENGMDISPLRIEWLRFEELNGRVLIAYEITWNILLSGHGAIDCFNNRVKPALSKAVRAMKVHGDRGIEIAVVNSMFQGDLKNGPWPRETGFAVNTF
jgi:hypothetical protein